MQNPGPKIWIDAFQSGDELLVILKGKLVLENCEAARARLTTLLTERVQRVDIYLGRLEFIDSAGWGAMVGLKMLANRNRTRLVFLSPSERVREIFRISKLDAIFEILDGPEAEDRRAALMKRENAVFRESQDESQQNFVTEANYPTHVTESEALRGPGHPRLDPRIEAATLAGDALEHLRNGSYAKAVELYKRLLEVQPDDLTALNNLGVVYEKRPEWRSDAVATWKRVLRLSEERQDAKHADRARKHLQYLDGLP